MADFTLDDANPDGNDRNATSGNNNGNTGSPSGEGTAANGANGVKGRTFHIEGQTGESSDAAPLGFKPDGTPRKRRAGGGRKPADAASTATGTSTNKSGKEGLAVKNDKAAVKQNILGLHAMAAVLTRQPILALQEKEGEALSSALCDVADYHGINILQTGGAFGLYASLCTVSYMIYIPRIQAIKAKRAGIETEPERPANPGDTREEAVNKAGTMDFSGDVKLH